MPTVSNVCVCVCVCVECTPWSQRDPFGLVIRDFFTFFLLQQGAAAAAVREREEERERERERGTRRSEWGTGKSLA